MWLREMRAKRHLNGTSKSKLTHRQIIWTNQLIENINPEGRCFEKIFRNSYKTYNLHCQVIQTFQLYWFFKTSNFRKWRHLKKLTHTQTNIWTNQLIESMGPEGWCFEKIFKINYKHIINNVRLFELFSLIDFSRFYWFVCMFIIKLDRVGSVDNRSSTD